MQGILAEGDGVDNDGDGMTDEAGERAPINTFVSYNNDSTVQGNPNGGDDVYRYLRGLCETMCLSPTAVPAEGFLQHRHVLCTLLTLQTSGARKM